MFLCISMALSLPWLGSAQSWMLPDAGTPSAFHDPGVPAGRPATNIATAMTIDELERVLKIDASGTPRRRDKISEFPEISTIAGYDFSTDDVVAGIGIEMFHKRNRPRSSPWKIELQLCPNQVGVYFGRILVPVVNFTIGPFIGYDTKNDRETYGIRMSFFKF